MSTSSRMLRGEREALERIERARRARPKVREERITLAHGAGGVATRSLVEAIFLPAFRNPLLEPLDDQALFESPGASLAFTTDSYVVSPLFFPGGSIGELAVYGTVNDLAMSGARPLHLSAGFILEEGFPVAELRRVVRSMAEAARLAGVGIATGDTKVVERGKGDGCYINTAGIGVLERPGRLGTEQIAPGDAVLVSGPIAEHGVTIMLARGELEIEADVRSDTAPLTDLVSGLLDGGIDARFMRDATRGGVATVLNEIATAAELHIEVDESAVPVRSQVNAACELLGIDPLHVACEGRMVVVVPAAQSDAAVAILRGLPHGEGACRIGELRPDPPGLVLLRTRFGGRRILDMLVGDPLPRIC